MSDPAPGPRVLALVPTWKAAAFIGRTLDALAAQDCPGLGILISDDASPDDTAARCERFAAGDVRFRVIRQERNRGWVGNVNALLAEAHGTGAEYLLFAFQDDLPEPGYVTRCAAALDADPGAVMAYSDIVLVHQDGRREEKRYTHSTAWPTASNAGAVSHGRRDPGGSPIAACSAPRRLARSAGSAGTRRGSSRRTGRGCSR